MQTQAEAEAAAYSCVLGEAERHMNGEPVTGGKCWQCDHFHEVQASDELPNMLRRMFDHCGLCDYFEDFRIVDRSEWHSWDECWEGH